MTERFSRAQYSDGSSHPLPIALLGVPREPSRRCGGDPPMTRPTDNPSQLLRQLVDEDVPAPRDARERVRSRLAASLLLAGPPQGRAGASRASMRSAWLSGPTARAVGIAFL